MKKNPIVGCFVLLACVSFAETKPDMVLRGTVNGTQNQHYVEVPFNVPDGIKRLHG